MAVSLEPSFNKGSELGSESFLIEQMVNSQSTSTSLGRVSGSDSFLSSADRRSAQFYFFQSIDDLVEVEDEVSSIREEKSTIAVESCIREKVRRFIQFRKERG